MPSSRELRPPQPPAPRGGRTPPGHAACPRPLDEAECPACGSLMRLWAGYYRCRTCGFKESCCF